MMCHSSASITCLRDSCTQSAIAPPAPLHRQRPHPHPLGDDTWRGHQGGIQVQQAVGIVQHELAVLASQRPLLPDHSTCVSVVPMQVFGPIGNEEEQAAIAGKEGQHALVVGHPVDNQVDALGETGGGIPFCSPDEFGSAHLTYGPQAFTTALERICNLLAADARPALLVYPEFTATLPDGPSMDST